MADSQIGTDTCLDEGFFDGGLLTICSSRVGAYLKGGLFKGDNMRILGISLHNWVWRDMCGVEDLSAKLRQGRKQFANCSKGSKGLRPMASGKAHKKSGECIRLRI